MSPGAGVHATILPDVRCPAGDWSGGRLGRAVTSPRHTGLGFMSLHVTRAGHVPGPRPRVPQYLELLPDSGVPYQWHS